MEKITKKEALSLLLEKDGITTFLNNRAFDKITDARLAKFTKDIWFKMCKKDMYHFKKYKDGYKRINWVTNECSYFDGFKDWEPYKYNSNEAIVVILKSDVFSTVIVNVIKK